MKTGQALLKLRLTSTPSRAIGFSPSFLLNDPLVAPSPWIYYDFMDLFDSVPEDKDPVRPLAIRMSPKTLEEYVGQEHLVGPGKLLRRLLESGKIVSLILYGPPGTGKTGFARLVARKLQGRFVALPGSRRLLSALPAPFRQSPSGHRPRLNSFPALSLLQRL